jgi:pyruvate,water dikinase
VNAPIVPIESGEAADASRFGPKAANLARLQHAGFPVPRGFCVDAEAYRFQVRALRLESTARDVASEDERVARHAALAMRLGLMDRDIAEPLRSDLLAARRDLAHAANASLVVRSSALVEDRLGASFAGQFESYLGLETEEEFETAVRACWAALWSTRVLRYVAQGDRSRPASSEDLSPPFQALAMGILVQPLVNARVSGGGLTRTPGSDDMVINATWGLGAAIAQGEVVPERIVVTRDGRVRASASGWKMHRAGCRHLGGGPGRSLFADPCLDRDAATRLAWLMRKAEDLLGMPLEIEWAQDEGGFKLLQARPLVVETQPVPEDLWSKHPRLGGQPAGVGWGAGRARVVSCECELATVAPGDVLVTKVAGPALGAVLPRVAAVVAELGGSTSHLASLARERSIPMVLGVADATTTIPDGSKVAVDGVAGIVRWTR